MDRPADPPQAPPVPPGGVKATHSSVVEGLRGLMPPQSVVSSSKGRKVGRKSFLLFSFSISLFLFLISLFLDRKRQHTDSLSIVYIKPEESGAIS
jgi:hypothetical protein